MDRKEIAQLYSSKGFDYRPSPQDTNEAEFYDRAEEDKEVKHRLEKVVRTKVAGDKEYILYSEVQIMNDKLGNPLHLTKENQGMHEEPQFTYQWNTETRKQEPIAIQGHKTVYDIPFSKAELQKILDLNTEEDINTQFLLQAGANALYGSFTADEFLNKTFDELLTKAQTGEYPKSTDSNKAHTATTTTESMGKYQPQSQHGTNRSFKEIKKGLVIEKGDNETDAEADKTYAEIEKRFAEKEEEPEPTTTKKSSSTTTTGKHHNNKT